MFFVCNTAVELNIVYLVPAVVKNKYTASFIIIVSQNNCKSNDFCCILIKSKNEKLPAFSQPLINHY